MRKLKSRTKWNILPLIILQSLLLSIHPLQLLTVGYQRLVFL